MPSFTLIIPTLGRIAELNRLFESLALQDFTRFECLVVDQNPGGYLDELLQRWESRLRMRRLRCAPGASRSRNLGLQFATGDIVAFPDDDCWYSAGLLSSIATWFQQHPAFSILTIGARDGDGQASGNRWVQRRCPIHPVNAFRTTFCSTIFIRRTQIDAGTRFDETLGPGSGTGSCCGEETDFILNLRRAGALGFFDRTWHIGHPRRDLLSGAVDAHRALTYGCGMGRVLRKHSLYMLVCSFILYDLLRSLALVFRGNRRAMALCFHHARGIVSGWRCA